MIKLPVSIHGDCETGLSDAEGQILFEAIYAKHSEIPKAQADIAEAMQALNGYGKAVEALKMIEGMPGDRAVARSALKDMGALDD